MEQDFFKLGVQAANAGDYQKAQACFIRVVQANPKSEKGWLYLGHCLSDSEKRIDCYQRVLRINPSNQEAQRVLSELSQLKHPQEVNQNPYERQPTPVRPTEQPRQTPPVQPGYTREMDQNSYERQPTPDRYTGQERQTPPVQTGYAREVDQNLYDYQPTPDRYTEQAQQTPPARAAKPQKRPPNKVALILGSIGGLVVCLGVVCFAITRMGPATPAPPASTSTPPLPVLDAAALPTPATSMGAGKACIGFWGRGVSCLDENGWQTYSIDNSELPDVIVPAGAFCPDGRLAIAHTKGFSLVRDGQWEHLPKLAEGYGIANDLACDRDGRLWTAHFRGVSRFMDGAWQTFDINLLAPGEKLTDENVLRIFAAPDGRIWTQTLRSVAMFANEKWTVFQQGQGLPAGPLALTLDAAGRAWVWYGDGVAVYDNGSWKQFQSTTPIPPTLISLDARGWLWMSSSTQGVSFFDGGKWSNHNRTTQSLSTDKVSALTTDTLGRVWVGTKYGLSVFDGSQWQTYRMDNSDLMDNKVTFVSVERDGPTLPPLVDKAKGSITGRFPMTSSLIVICTEPVAEQFSGDTPCFGQPFVLSTESYMDGSFVFENVPPGYYYMYAKTGNDWAGLLEDNGFDLQRILVKPGEQYDLGSLEVTEGG